MSRADKPAPGDEHIEHTAADEIRRLLSEDERFHGVSGATAFRTVDLKRGWQNAGFFSFLRNGGLYFVTVEQADPPEPPKITDHVYQPWVEGSRSRCRYSWFAESRIYCERPESQHAE